MRVLVADDNVELGRLSLEEPAGRAAAAQRAQPALAVLVHEVGERAEPPDGHAVIAR